MDFSQVIGQTEVKQRLLNMVREDRIPHAMLFSGPQGGGKLPLALAFAQYLLCQHPGEDAPCGQCPSCKMVQQWAHPDLHFTFPVIKQKSSDHPLSDDYMSVWREQLSRSVYFSIEDWTEDMKADNQQPTYYVEESDSLIHKLALKSSQGGRKIVLMWLPERMNQQTANKLLKLIEEPPLHTHFLLVSEDADQILGTILSRVQRIHVPALSEEQIRDSLTQQMALPLSEAEIYAHVAQGSYTQALRRIAAGSDETVYFELFVQLMRLSYQRKIKEMRQWSETLAAMGRERQKKMLEYCQDLIRENFMYNFGHREMNFMTREEEQFATKFARFVNERNVIPIMEELSDAQRDIEQNVNAKMVFFDFALKMIVLIKQAN